ncbi:hypothetical protein ACR9GP_25720 [Enterobacter ludwigii]
MNTRQSSDLLEVMEDRYQRGSIISQPPVNEWYKRGVTRRLLMR